jgi:glyoxylate reductase
MARIFVTSQLPGDRLQELAAEHELTVFSEDRPITREELLAGVKDADVLISLLGHKIDKEVMKAGKNLKIIANYAVGTNNINVDWATLNDIVVLNTPDVLTDATADVAFGLLLATARRFGEGERMVRNKEWTGWAPQLLLGPQVTGKTLGIIGMGRIGQAMARRARGFEMNILYSNRNRVPVGVERELGADYVSVEELLEQSDFVSLHCPLTPDTHHLLDKAAFARMKKGSILINTARGPVVDEAAMVNALKSGHLFGAGLDVFEEEPTIHPELFEMENVVMLPHIGTASIESREEMVKLLVTGIQAVLKRQRPKNIVNPDVFN